MNLTHLHYTIVDEFKVIHAKMDDLSQVNGKLDAIMESLSKSCMEENTSRKIPLSLKVFVFTKNHI